MASTKVPLRVDTRDHAPYPHRTADRSPPPVGPPRPPRLYEIPGSFTVSALQSQSAPRPRPGGLAALPGAGRSGLPSSNLRSPPESPSVHPTQQRPGWARKGSEEAVGRPLTVRRGSDHALPAPTAVWSQPARGRATPPPGLVRTAGGTSVYSGREGSVHGGRTEGVTSPNPTDLRNFAHHCRRFYFSPNPPEESATYISSTLASLPPSHRAAYTRLQSSLRALAHLHHLRLRISSFHALISTTVASGSLTPSARLLLHGKTAKLERRDKLSRFISTWCTSNAGGVEPFFRGLWSVLRAQSRGDDNRGGGGQRRVIWELDDAVFLESGGPEFMHEAVMMLKGVLGFTDQPLTTPPRLKRIRTIPRSYSNMRLGRSKPSSGSQERSLGSGSFSQLGFPGRPAQPLQIEEVLTGETDVHSDGQAPPLPPRHDPNSRSRATSDPFIDARSISPQKRTPSGRGPAPPPPPSRKPGSKMDVSTSTSIPNPLQTTRTSMDTQLTVQEIPDPSSNVNSPLLPEMTDANDSVTRVLQAAALRSNAMVPQRHRLDSTVADDRTHLLSARRTMSDDSEMARGLYGGPAPEHAIVDEEEEEDPTEDDIATEEAELNRPRYRLWTFPVHISDEEAESLMKLFPVSITRTRGGKVKDVRFPFVRPGRGIKDLESGDRESSRWETVFVNGEEIARIPQVAVESEEGVVRSGTGRMWVGLEVRGAGWRGGKWFRFRRWWRRLFGRG
ncbi:hypothetical protein M231_02711 [Tremella mesenterica]|uniref:Uncharacterized protein n=1 Tax=Tremella mesenterica TaxID=5217 RepID=A0A4Q1BQ61_TREME|nr:hypothetical protein M231_02711 [Tremella mesenterica]